MVETTPSPSARVFISYKREDLIAAQRLSDALNAAGFEAFLDLHDIKPGEPWRERLSGLIATAEKLVFLISPLSVASEICDWEVNEAERQGKTVLPVVIEETARDAIPPRLSRLNFIQARDDAEFAAAISMLAEALATDLAWERERTRINDLAETWDRRDRRRSLLIWRDDAIREAEEWRDSHPPTAPAPSPTQLAFITESRRRFTARQRWIRGGLAGVAATLAIAAGAAVFFGLSAEERRVEAERQRAQTVKERDRALLNESRLLARSAEEAISGGRVAEGVALARRALPANPAHPLKTEPQQGRPFTPEALDALYRAYGTPYPKSVFRGHTGPILGALALSQNRLLSWGADGAARIWSEDGAQLAVMRGPVGPITRAQILKSGAIMTFGEDDETARLWTANGEPVATMQAPFHRMTRVEEMPDGSLLTLGDKLLTPGDETPILWDAQGRRLQTAYPMYGGAYNVHTLSGGGFLRCDLNRISFFDQRFRFVRYFSIPEDFQHETMSIRNCRPLDRNRILVWDGFNKIFAVFSWEGEVLSVVEKIPANSDAPLLLGNGSILSWASGADKDAKLYLWRPGEAAVATCIGHGGPIKGAIILKDGTVLSWSNDGTARLWDARCTALAEFKGHAAPIEGATELDGGRILTWGRDRTLRVWTGRGGQIARIHTGPPISGALALNGGDFVSWHSDGVMRRWRGDGGAASEFIRAPNYVGGVAQFPDRRLLTWSAEETLFREEVLPPPAGRDVDFHVRLWSVSGELLHVLEGHKHIILGAAILSGGRAVTYDIEGEVFVWSSDGALLARFQSNVGVRSRNPQSKRIRGVLELSEDRILVYGLHGEVFSLRGEAPYTLGETPPSKRPPKKKANAEEIEEETGDPLFPFEISVSSDAVHDALVLTDGRILTRCTEERDQGRLRTCEPLLLWNADGARAAQIKWPGLTEEIIELADGRLFAYSKFNAPNPWWKIYDWETGRWTEIDRPDAPIQFVKRFDDGEVFVSTRDNLARLYDREMTLKTTFRGHNGIVADALKLADGRLLTQSGDKRLRIWTPEGTEVFTRYVADLGGVAQFELQKGLMLSRSGDGATHVWPLEERRMIAWADALIDASPPLSIRTRCDHFLLPPEICALTPHVAGQHNVHEALFLQGKVWLKDSNPRAEAAFREASARGGEALAARVKAYRAGQEARETGPKTPRDACQARYALQRPPDEASDDAPAPSLAAWRSLDSAVFTARKAPSAGERLALELRAWADADDLFFRTIADSSNDRGRHTVWSISRGWAYALKAPDRAGSSPATGCDRLAAHPSDPLRVAPGVGFKDLDKYEALKDCDAAVLLQPDEPRHRLNRARVYERFMQSHARGVWCKARDADLEIAMAAGYPIAFNNKGLALGRETGAFAAAGRAFAEHANRTVHCCWAHFVQTKLLATQQTWSADLRRAVQAVTLWSKALGAQEADALLEKLYASGALQRPSAPDQIAPAKFSDFEPWMRPRADRPAWFKRIYNERR